MRTTAIYGDVSGPEEQDFAARMCAEPWRSWRARSLRTRHRANL